MSRKWIGFVLLTGMLLAGCAPPRLPSPTSTPTHTSVPASQTPPPAAAATATPTPTQPSATPTPTPSPTPTPPESIASWALVYRPADPERSVATARWSEDGDTLFYALSPAPGGYLLDWYAYDISTGATRAIRSPNFGFADAWRKAEVGFPRTSDPFSELRGFVSSQYKKVIYPNAGFPDAGTNPNYVFVILADNKNRQRVLGPIFRGTVGRAAWIDFDNKVIFDYRYEGRAVIYLADLLKGRTETLFELSSDEISWRVSPDEKYLLIPQNGQSVLLALDSSEPLFLDTAGGMARPEWTQDSQTIYFWAGSENRIISYNLAGQSFHPLLVRRDLETFSPLPPVYGMPFSVSPDASRVVFFWENWIWFVELAAAH